VIVTAAVLLVAFSLISDGQPPRDAAPQTGTAIIRGRVVGAATGDPIRKARVSISSDAPGPRDPAFTDGQGRFVFTDLPAGRYSIVAAKPGFAKTVFGAKGLVGPSTRIDVANGEDVDGIEVRMPRSGAISGHIVDEFGDPVELASVSAQRIVRTESGTSSTVAMASTATDDLGEYYLGGLPAGTFVVNAMLPIFQMVNTVTIADGVTQVVMRTGDVPPRTYYPGVATLSQAQPIAVRAGEERSATDFTVAPGATAKLSMRFVDAKGAPVDANAMIASADESTTGVVNRPVLMVGPNQSTALQPGQWVIYARGMSLAGNRPGPMLVGMTRISLNAGDDTSVTVPMVTGAHISGKVTADGGPLPPRAQIRIEASLLDPALADAAGFVSMGFVLPDGVFDLSGIIGRRELRVPSMPRGYLASAVLYEGRNLIDSPIDFKGGEELLGVQVVLTSRLSQLTGTATDAAKAPVSDYSVLLFPEDPALLKNSGRLARWVRPNQRGQFTSDDLLPGSYLVIAVDDVDADQWQQFAYLNQFREHAARVTLGDAEKKAITLELRSAR